MNPRLLFFAFFSIALPLHAGWSIYLPPPFPNVARIQYSAKPGDGDASFAAALKELSDSGRIQNLDGIIAFQLLPEATFQEELFATLRRDAPRELEEALNSSGNMHNPKTTQLTKAFLKAVLATPTVTKLNAALAPYGLKIDHASIEKFELPKVETEKSRRFWGSLWLTVTTSSNHALERMPRAFHESSLSLRSFALNPI